MAESPEALSVNYDSTNDVLYVMTSNEECDPIAVPGPENTTILITEDLDRVVGIVIEHFLPTLRAQLPESLRKQDDELLVRVSMGMVQTLLIPVLRHYGPPAKDQVARWLEFVDQAGI
jgi:hypothetical protein